MVAHLGQQLALGVLRDHVARVDAKSPVQDAQFSICVLLYRNTAQQPHAAAILNVIHQRLDARTERRERKVVAIELAVRQSACRCRARGGIQLGAFCRCEGVMPRIVRFKLRRLPDGTLINRALAYRVDAINQCGRRNRQGRR